MKKLLMKGKGFLAIFVLALMAAGMISSVTQASLKATGERQYKASKGYRSHTKVTGAYDGRGFPLNISIYASIGDKSTLVHTSASGTANSPYLESKKNAFHGYGIGNSADVVWMDN